MVNRYVDNRLNFPATKRNREFIASVLKNYISSESLFLEIASGSGEHGVFFQRKFPSIIWQTSDPDPACRKSISSWINHEDLSSKMPQPLDLNVERRPWPLTKRQKSLLKGIVCINMFHISPWSSTVAFFEESKVISNRNSSLIIYGPFLRTNVQTSESNANFNRSLVLQNPLWGLRHIEDVNEVAYKNGFIPEKVIDMPANNISVIYRLN